MLLALSWNGIPLPEGGRLWVGLVPIALGAVLGLWKGRGKVGEWITNLRAFIAPAPASSEADAPADESVSAAIVTLARAAKRANDPAMSSAAVDAFKAFAKVEPEVKP